MIAHFLAIQKEIDKLHEIRIEHLLSHGRHRKSGTPPTFKHFTGKTKGKRITRKGISKKQRKLNRGKHRDKYEG